MAKPSITTRAGKGSALTWAEGDANFTNLQTAAIPDGGVAGDVIVKNSSTNWDFSWSDRVNAKTIYETVKNVSGGSLSKGTPVYQVGMSGNSVTVAAARADDINKLAVGVLDETIADQAEGRMLILGEIKGVDTASFSIGDRIYLGETGGYTNTPPTGSTVARQFLGVVFRVDSTNGSGYITGTLLEDYVKFNGTSFEFWDGDSWVTGGGGGLANVVEDTTPQLGGDLDTNSYKITSAANANVVIEPNGTGDVLLTTDTVQIGDVNANAKITTNGTGDLTLDTNSGTNSGRIVIQDGSSGNIEIYSNALINLSNAGTQTTSLKIGTDMQLYSNSSYSYIANSGIPVYFNTNNVTLGNGTLDADSGIDLVLRGGQGSGGTITLGGTANSNITILPNGTGDVILSADTVQVGDSGAAATITTNGAGNLVLNTNAGTNSGSITIAQGANANITLAPNGTGATVANGNFTAAMTSTTTSVPIVARHTVAASASVGNNSLSVQKARSDIALASMTDEPAIIVFSVRDNTNATRNFAKLNANYIGTGTYPNIIFNTSVDNYTTNRRVILMNEATATFGHTNTNYTITTNGTANLTLNTNSGTNSGSIVLNQGANANITLTPNGTGQTKITNLQYNEKVFDYGNSGVLTWTPDAANGNVQTITLTGNLTLNAFSNPVSGQTITFIITQDATGSRTLTSTMKFAGGSKTLSTAANSIDILTVSYIGTTYYATLSKGYA